MYGCLQSATISIIINKSPTREFKATEVLGNSLAPFLFLIIVEGRSRITKTFIFKKNELERVKVGSKEVLVNALQFASDMLIFSKAKTHNIVVIERMLRCLELVFELKVNFNSQL